MAPKRTASCSRKRRSMKRSDSAVSISCSNSKLSSNDSGGRTSLSTRLDRPFARSHMQTASGPSRVPSSCLSSAAKWPSVWIPHLCRIAKISCTSICRSMQAIYSKLFICSSEQLDNFHRTLWERLHKGAAVGFCHDAIVEDDNDAAVAFGSNQAAYPLSKFEDRFGQGILSERIAAALLDQFQFGFDERMIGHGKRKTCNDHIRKRLARNIHAAPKAVRAKEDSSRR